MNEIFTAWSKLFEHRIELAMGKSDKSNRFTQHDRRLLEKELASCQKRIRTAKAELQSRFRLYTEEVERAKSIELMLSAHATMH
ncbi:MULTISPECIES: hypothetical protein [unclassified Pseudomonas]|uniref:hypothetical protein n=1 Tax=unclassified Pseudomonas TaxID=196821 RepID=UPI00235E3A7A|nr:MULTISPECIES: hypothetical protein [unclassified Pseudomonas]